MSFTHPVALWLLGLCVVPLLLSRRRPVVRHVVANAYLWREAARRVAGPVAPRRTRFTPLVVAQMACIGALVLSLAGPVVTARGGRTAIVLDLSASMGARDGQITRLDAARARLRTLVGSLPRLSRVRVILAEASPRVTGEWSATDPRLSTTVDALTPGGGTADLSSAIDLATAAGDVSRIVVLTDSDLTQPAGRPTPLSLQVERVGHPVENAAVTRVGLRRSELGGRGGDVLVALRNYGSSARDAEVEIGIDGRAVHRARVRLGPRDSRTQSIAVQDLGRVVTARLVGADALPVDDSRSIAVPLASPIRVALIGPGDSFLERALAANPSVSLRTDSRDAVNAPATRDVDVLVCDRCSGSTAAGIPSLIIHEPGALRTREAMRVVATTHPLADALDTGGVTATAGGPATASGLTEVVLRVGGVAAVTASDAGDRRRVDVYVDLTSPDFALSPAFPVLVANAVGWLAAKRALPSDVIAGEPLAFAATDSGAGAVRVAGPDGRDRDVRRAGGQVVVVDTDAPGLYRVQLTASERVIAVNPNVGAESDLSSPQAVALDRTGVAAATVPGGVDAGSWLMLLAFALLALEWRLRLQGAR